MSRRHLSSSLFCLLLAASGGAAAYGLGEARVLSALGEPLRVSLPVKLSPGTGLDASCLQIAAPPGRETPFIADLLRAQFRVTEVGDGLAEVLITTRRPWTEPILVFPLRVGCGAGGATYREITLLIDPPNLVVPSAPVAAAPAAPQPPAPAPRPRARVEPARPAPAPAAPSSGGQWKVERGQTLSGIIAKTGLDGGSRQRRWQLVEQVVAANPDVFRGRGADYLPAGATLTIPGWDGTVAAAPPPKPAAEPAKPAPKPAEEPGYRVKIAAPEGTGTPGEIAKVSEEVRALEAVTEQERQKQVELESKIEALRREAAELQDTAKRLNTLMTDMREQVDPGAAATAPDAAAPAAPAPAAPVQLPAAPPAVTPPPTPPAPAPGDEPGDLLGSWVGIVVGLLLFGLLVVWVMLRRRTRQPSQGELEQALAAAAPPAGPSISRKVVPLAKSKAEEAEPAEPAAATAAPELPPMYARQAEEDDEIQVEEVSDLLEQAEIMLLVGDPTEAADVLEKFIEENGGRSAEPRPWLKLLEVLHVTGQRGRFALWSLRFNRRFNIQRPSWEDFEGDRDEEGHMTLELTFPRVTERLIELWPDSGAALAFIEELIINDRPQARLGFARPVADEILMLRDLARYRMMSS